MIKTIKIFNISGQKKFDSIDINAPRQCPRCKTGIDTRVLSAFYIKSKEDQIYNLFVLCFCPICETCFTAHYHIYEARYAGIYSTQPISIYPYPDVETAIANDVAEISPRFVKIFHQAEKAENMGLDEICGIGYRKALEFLIKDYAIFFHPEDEETIKDQQLSPCINNFIENENIKTLATASAWIGNDETHYVRKHEDYNLDHLKAFINSIVSFINSQCAYHRAKALLENSLHKTP